MAEKTEDIKEDKKADSEAPEWAKKLDAKIDSCMSRMDDMEAFHKKADSEKDGEGKPEKTAADKKKADSEGEKEEEEMEKEEERDEKKDDSKKGDSKRVDARADSAVIEAIAEAKAARKAAEKALVDLENARSDAAAAKRQFEELKSAFASDLSSLRSAVSISDEDRAVLADIQARADMVEQLFGVDRHASPPQVGETPLAYRKRLATRMKAHSARWKDVDLAAFDDAVLTIAETDIYADAAGVANHPAETPPGKLIEVKKTDPRTGRVITEFKGDKSAWMEQFTGAKYRVASINKDFH